MMRRLVLVVMAIGLLWSGAAAAASDAGSVAGRLGQLIYDQLAPKVKNMNYIVEDLRPIPPGLSNEREYNIVNEVIWHCSEIALYGSFEMKMLQLHEQVRDDAKAEYYRKMNTDLKNASKMVRGHVDELIRLGKFVKVAPAIPLLEKALQLAPQMANDLDVAANIVGK